MFAMKVLDASPRLLRLIFLFIFSMALFCAFADDSDHIYTPDQGALSFFPADSDKFSPVEGSPSGGFELHLEPTKVYPHFVLHGGTDSNYGYIARPMDHPDGPAEIPVSLNSNYAVEVLVKVVQQNTSHYKTRVPIEVSISATPLYLNGDRGSEIHTGYPSIVDDTLTLGSPIIIDGEGDAVFYDESTHEGDPDYSVTETHEASSVCFKVSYSGKRIPAEVASSSEVLVGLLTYKWDVPQSFGDGIYSGSVTLTCTIGD